MINKSLVLTVIAALLPFLLYGRQLEVHYVAHDHYEVVLGKMLAAVWSDAKSDPEKTVVLYLANGDEPVVLVSTSEDKTDIDGFINELNSRTRHSVYPESDRLYIMEKLAGEEWGGPGFDGFSKVVFNFYINKSFVETEFCDALIARLYWDLELGSLPKGSLAVNVLYPRESGNIQALKASALFGKERLMGYFEPRVVLF